MNSTRIPAQVGFVDGASIVVVFVGDYWLAHAQGADWDHGVGATPRAAVTTFIEREVPRGAAVTVLWETVDALPA